MPAKCFVTVTALLVSATAMAQSRGAADSIAPRATGPAASAPSGAAAAAPHQELGELVTDRPDFTESSEVVGHGVVQIETGFSFESDGAEGTVVRTMSSPQALARIGLGRRFELRVGGDGWLSESAPGTGDARRLHGAGDMEVGFKYKLFQAAPASFAMAVIPLVSLPVGSGAFSSGAYDPCVKLTWAMDAPGGFGLSGNVNVASVSDDGGRFTQRSVSASLGHDLVAGWGGYWEVYGFTPFERGTTSGWIVNSGITHGIGPHMQIDLEAGRGVTDAAPDWFVGVGFAMRAAPWRR